MAELKQEFATIVSEIHDLARRANVSSNSRARRLKSDDDPRQTLKNAIDTLKQIEPLPPLQLRTVHHFSCTGGTMLAKCIASMANTVVLNEVDPLSPIPFRDDVDRFNPTDLVALLHQSGSPPDAALVAKLFGKSIEQVAQSLENKGKLLVLRDHTHGHFLYGAGRDNQYTLKNILDNAGLASISLVTVRHPARSYQSMVKMGWDAHLTPNTFDEYCQRYLSFLEAYSGIPIVRYEDFVAAPKKVMKTICDLLALNYYEDFQEVFDQFNFSGDSGRSGGAIEPRPPSPIGDDLREQLSCSSYRELVKKLSYDSAL